MGDKKKYPQAFYVARPLVLERAGNRCESCGAENHQTHPVSGKRVRLQIHHLDWNIKNNDIDNLRAYCAKCHGIFKKKKIGIANKPGKRELGKKTQRKMPDYRACSLCDKIVRKNKSDRHSEPSRLVGEVTLFDAKLLRVFLRKNKVVLRKLRLYSELARIVGGFTMSDGENTEKAGEKQGASPTESSRFPMLKSQGELISERRKEREIYEQESDQAIKWFKSLPFDRQETIKARICKAHPSMIRSFTLERFFGGLKYFVWKEWKDEKAKEGA
jgi:hypothetical protein